MTRLAAAAATVALTVGIGGLGVTAAPAAHAGGLESCGSYYKVKNISCGKAAAVVEEGYARLLDKNGTQVRFDGWTCKRKNTSTKKFKCTKRVQGTTKVIKFSGA